MSDDVNRAEFWEKHYANGTDAWEKGEPAPPLAAYFAGPDAPAPGRALVVGCGRGHDALMLAERGWQVTGLDISRPPIDDARAAAAARGLELELEVADLFTWAADPARAAGFDLWVEYTCYCAIDPARRDAYADLVVHALAPGGLLVGVFWACGMTDGPPWTCTPDELRARFGSRLELVSLEPAVGSFEGARTGNEWLLVARRA